MTQQEQIRMLDESIATWNMETGEDFVRPIPQGVGIMEQLPQGERGPVGDPGINLASSISSTWSTSNVYYYYSTGSGTLTVDFPTASNPGQVLRNTGGVPQWVPVDSSSEVPQQNEIRTPPYSFYTALRIK